jgi:hypothetical protein
MEMWELATTLRIKENAQKWASAQKLITRQRKFAFGVVWELFGQEVKEGRCALLHADLLKFTFSLFASHSRRVMW